MFLFFGLIIAIVSFLMGQIDRRVFVVRANVNLIENQGKRRSQEMG